MSQKGLEVLSIATYVSSPCLSLIRMNKLTFLKMSVCNLVATTSELREVIARGVSAI